jgi:hypothetical protein
MKLQNQKPNNTVVFSKWTRKNYAVFASLKKVINILHLSIHTCFSLLVKNKFILRLLNQTKNFEISNTNCNKEQIPFSQRIIILLLEMGIISIEEALYLTQEKDLFTESPCFALSKMWAFLLVKKHISNNSIY